MLTFFKREPLKAGVLLRGSTVYQSLNENIKHKKLKKSHNLVKLSMTLNKEKNFKGTWK